jgi:rRNA-processing protein FCF1
LGVSSGVDDSEIRDILTKFNCTLEEPKAAYEKWIFKGDGIKVVRYEKKLFVQGRKNDENLQLIQELSKVDGLKFDIKNVGKFVKLFRFFHNAILCDECKDPSLLIVCKIQELDIVFQRECGHKNSMAPPLLTLTSRILPDINALIAGHLSKCISLGFFDGFEVVIPHFVMSTADTLGTKKKGGVSTEIGKLKEFAKANKITIFYCEDGIPVPSTEKEDDIILKIAKLTNSILITGDSNLKDNALLNNRPTIFIHPKDSKKIKIIEKVRRPYLTRTLL